MVLMYANVSYLNLCDKGKRAQIEARRRYTDRAKNSHNNRQVFTGKMKSGKNIWRKKKMGGGIMESRGRLGGTRHAGRARREEVVITQLRCGHTGLNNILHKIRECEGHSMDRIS